MSLAMLNRCRPFTTRNRGVWGAYAAALFVSAVCQDMSHDFTASAVFNTLRGCRQAAGNCRLAAYAPRWKQLNRFESELEIVNQIAHAFDADA